jgi:hypothetical protein
VARSGTHGENNKETGDSGRARPQPAPRGRRWILTLLLLLLMLLFAFGVINWRYPMVRTSSPMANAVALFFILLVPTACAALSCFFSSRRGKIYWAVACGFITLCSAPFVCLVGFNAFVISPGSTNGGLEPIRTVNVNNSSIVVYSRNLAAFSGLDVIVRHEREIGGGVKLVKNIFILHKCEDADVRITGPGRITIEARSYKDPFTVITEDVALREWVHF